MGKAAAVMLVGALVCTSVVAGGMPCEKIEYAQLKDSSKKELSDAYCSAKNKAKLNAELRQISMDLAKQQNEFGSNSASAADEARQKGEAQVGCLRVAETASSMLKKKFNAKPPASCG